MKRIVLCFILMFVFSGLSSSQALAAYGDWAYSTRVYLDTSESGSQVAGSVIDFPILIRLDGSSFDFSQAQQVSTSRTFPVRRR